MPSWLSEDQRFEVKCASNEVSHVEKTLALMRDALHPKLCARMKPGDLAPTLEWIVRVSQPGVATNEMVYFNAYKSPLSASAFDVNMLTNRASKLSIVPPSIKLSLIFNDGRRNSVLRAVPGVDYPGVVSEDAGSTLCHIRIALCAPKNWRHFRVRAEIMNPNACEYEFKWMKVTGLSSVFEVDARDLPTTVSYGEIRVASLSITPTQPSRLAVFARPMGGLWGVPGIIDIRTDDLSVNRVYEKGCLFSIDYGLFKDIYLYDEKDRILGFERIPADSVRGVLFSYLNERIIDEYSEGRPKTTRKVRYGVNDGRLIYTEADSDIVRENQPPEDRAARW